MLGEGGAQIYAMGDEAIEGSKMGSKLIMFGAIVALAIVAFLAGKNLMGTGIKNMEDTVAAINDSRFSDYNGKIVRGRQVKYAIDTFANENVAIFIHTLEMGNDTTSLSTDHPDWALSSSAATTGKKRVLWKFTAGSAGSDTVTKGSLPVDTKAGTSTTDCVFVNYGSMLDGKSGTFELDSGVKFTGDFESSDSGSIAYNAETQNITRQGRAEYVADGANYNAALIRNSSNEIIGILFYQMKTN